MASINPDLVEWKQRLGLACGFGRDDEVRALLTSENIDSETRNAGLQIALQRATFKKAGQQSTALLLLDEEFSAASLLSEATLKATFQRVVDNDHHLVLRKLLKGDAKAYLEVKDKHQRSPLFSAALKGHLNTVQALFNAGANINTKAANGQTVLIYFASEKGPGSAWTKEVLKWFLDNEANLVVKDNTEKNALHWAAMMGKVDLTKALLAAKADVHEISDRGRTALHFAAAGDHHDDASTVVGLLLNSGADPTRESDGGWTALHNAAQVGNFAAVKKLVECGSNINAVLSSEVTPLHWAAANGHEEVVRYLIEKEEIQKHRKDVFGSTPLIRAAQNGFTKIAKLLSPVHDGVRLSKEKHAACKCNAFKATVVDFEKTGKQGPPNSRVKRYTIFDVIYDSEFRIRNRIHQSDPKNKFRWIHLPANNMAWVEALFTKLFVEEEATDVDNFKTLLKTLTHQHRGRHVHSTFMIPQCTHTRASPTAQPTGTERQASAEKVERTTSAKLGGTDPGSTTLGGTTLGGTTIGSTIGNTPTKKKEGKGARAKLGTDREPIRKKKKPYKFRRESTNSLTADSRKDSMSERQDDYSEDSSGGDAYEDETGQGNGNIVLFMPYLHFETHDRRLHMSETIKSVKSGVMSASTATTTCHAEDVLLMRAYLDSYHSLHPRRTLDQFLYHSFDTEKRDADQVVYRYFINKRKHQIPKIYMVDQLWLWIWGKDLIVTSFPQRWGQSQLKNDPLCVLDGVIEDINSKTRPPVRSVFDLAMLITGRCSGGFDRHRLGDFDYQFMDMFDTSIGDLSVREPELFEKFEKASSDAADWLREQRDRTETQKGKSLDFFNDLLDIKEETTLLKELKDIRDELNIISMIFRHQKSVLKDFETAVCEEQEDISESQRRFREQKKLAEVHIQDVRRMDKQAETIFTSLTQILAFKQQHSNAVESRFSREQASQTARQAELAARQGETIMVFTIVTIFFLPISFIAAFFTINIADFPALTLTYVSKFVFGIGLAISLVLITVAFLLDDIRRLWRGQTHKRSVEQQNFKAVSSESETDSFAAQPMVEVKRSDSGTLGPPARIFSGLSRVSALTGRSVQSGAQSRHSRDPEWG